MRSAYDIPFSPGDPTMWEQDPRTVWHALEEMATRQASDVDGPASSTDNTLVRFDGTTGKLIQGSGWILSDANLLTALGPLDVSLTEIRFGGGSDISGGVADITLAIAGTDRLTVGASEVLLGTDINMAQFDMKLAGNTKISGTASILSLFANNTLSLSLASNSLLVPQGNRIDFDTDADTSIRASGDDVLVLESGGVDVVTLTAAQMALVGILTVSDDIKLAQGKKLILDTDLDTFLYSVADDAVIFSIGNVAVMTGAPTVITITQDIALTQAKRIDLDTDKDTSIRASADDSLQFETGGTDRFTLGNTAATLRVALSMDGKGISNLSSLALNDGGLIGIDANTNVVINDDTSFVFKLNTTEVLDVTTALLDGKGVLKLAGFGGRRGQFVYGWNTTNTAATRVPYGPGFGISGGNKGYVAVRAGSVVGISINVDINAISAGDCGVQFYKNGSLIASCLAMVSSPVVANAQNAQAAFANGTFTFAAGDILSAARIRTTGTLTTDDFTTTLEVEYDS